MALPYYTENIKNGISWKNKWLYSLSLELIYLFPHYSVSHN